MASDSSPQTAGAGTTAPTSPAARMEEFFARREAPAQADAFFRSPWFAPLALVCCVVAFYCLSRYSYLLFHSLAEMFSVAVAWTIFFIAWNTRQYTANRYLFFVGVAHAAVGALLLVHALSYKGMGIFHPYDPGLSPQLWIAARGLQSASLLAAPLFIRRNLTARYALVVYASATAVLLFTIFAGWFPDCFIESRGLTTFKILSEYVIILFFLLALARLYKHRREFEKRVLRLIMAYMGVACLSEIAFTLYVDLYGMGNVLGHLLEVASFYFLYEAIVHVGLTQPFSILFREMKEHEGRLLEETNKLNSIIDFLPYPFLVLDRDGRALVWNKAVAELTGVHADAVLGKGHNAPGLAFYDQKRPLLAELVLRRDKAVERGYRVFKAEGEVLFAEGEIEPRGRQVSIQAKASPLYDKDGRVVGAMEIVRDITERRVGELELARKNQELEAFSYSVSHDLRAPLRAINGFSEILSRRYRQILSPDAAHYLDNIILASARMGRLIDDLLTYSRLGRRSISLGPADVAEILEQLLVEFKPRLAEKNAALVVAPAPPGMKPIVNGDVTLLHQIFSNLIENGLVYHSPGLSPAIEISWTERESRIEFAVRDNGIGIEAEHHGKIFNVFQRLHSEDEYPGTGIGLAIVKMSVEKLGGGLRVESEPGQGSVFYVTLQKGAANGQAGAYFVSGG